MAGRDGFTRAHAIGLIWIGWTLAGATVLGAMVFGLLVALDQRRLLAEQARTLRRIRRGLAPPPQPRPVADHEPARLLNRLTPR